MTESVYLQTYEAQQLAAYGLGISDFFSPSENDYFIARLMSHFQIRKKEGCNENDKR